MTTRYDRRKAKRELNWKLSNQTVQKILRAELEAGRGTEIYRLERTDNGEPRYFNISAMRPWVEANIEVGAFPLDYERAARLIQTGAVDMDHLENHTIQTELKPIIVCREGGGPAQDQIVDGAHRFVALHMGAAAFGLGGGIPGYLVYPADWKQFLVPPKIAERIFKF
ncbi:hypothetical protein M9978_00545 [Sphingomonas sp. MG17]|uniref:Uncharacterized protein n=1 Tax=Sphingomonas tagetis TaxID=2949092 RepID=A0A9X2KJT7_9SPHN|nr:hypothetical protein [Sphingomonas tagetis]MCP3728907.1 hypothetical protein [Sphingomonas tagetis]